MKKFLFLFMCLCSIGFSQTRPDYADIKNAPLMDIRTLGCKPGIDASEKIQAYVDSQGVGVSCSLFFPAGDWLLSESITFGKNTINSFIPQSSVYIGGEGACSRITYTGSSQAFILKNYSHNAIVEKLTIIGNGLYLEGSIGVRLDKLVIQGDIGIKVASAGVFRLRDSILKCRICCDLYYFSSDSVITGNDLYFSEAGIKAQSGNQLTPPTAGQIGDYHITNNVFTPSEGGIGILFDIASGTYISQTRITGNEMWQGPNGQCIRGIRRPGGANTIRELTVTDNQMWGTMANATPSVELDAFVFSIYSNNTHPTNGTVKISNAINSTITGNIFTESVGTPLTLTGATHSIINNNNFREFDTAIASAPAILLTDCIGNTACFNIFSTGGTRTAGATSIIESGTSDLNKFVFNFYHGTITSPVVVGGETASYLDMDDLQFYGPRFSDSTKGFYVKTPAGFFLKLSVDAVGNVIATATP